MAEHAHEEKADGEHEDVPQQPELQALVGEEPCYDVKYPDEAAQVDVAPVPTVTLEAQDEGEQVYGERHHPQEQNREDVLREVVRDREQHHRTHRRESEP